ncbi:hypothetical protein J2T57_004247 [Natronocella acetinitrilica]|uniref:Uncharacterized protein n=1 Tax=Natronocella acetinitrilica TaxID=414046 RepID=A0AAE3KE53_9GAMM|nr:hypothetical protein [Natronocella acetinitrilica]MCP1677073.1 hypothetical protein [Natronocella acetinitrilica]
MQTTAGNHYPGVSWGAILAGAACAAAFSFILLILGFGLGLSSISPWSNSGVSAAVIGVSSFIWVAFTQITASGLGGYLAGRLRVKWIDVDNNEVYFRDTAHGLITWAVATLFAAALLTSTVSGILSGGAKAGAEIAGGAASAAGSLVETTNGSADQDSNYFVDSLLRTSPGATGDQRANDDIRSELSTIIFRDLINGDLSTEDSRYAAQVVANHTGLTEQQAQERVTTVVNQARELATEARQTALDTAEATRKTAAYSSLWMFVALLCGAFFASFMATVGGRQRDALA